MRSVSSPRAVSMSTGTSEPARMRRQTSKPSRSGSMTSRSTAWKPPRARSDRPRSARGATVTWRPLFPRYSDTIAASRSSSSIISTRSATLRMVLRPAEKASAGPGRRSGSTGVMPVHALDERLALLGGEDVAHVGERLHEAPGGLVGHGHLGLADLFERRPVDGGPAELGRERVAVVLMLLPEPEQIVDRAAQDLVHLLLLGGARVDVAQGPFRGDLQVLLGRLRVHRVMTPARPPRVVEAATVVDGGHDRPRAEHDHERARSEQRVKHPPSPAPPAPGGVVLACHLLLHSAAAPSRPDADKVGPLSFRHLSET